MTIPDDVILPVSQSSADEELIALCKKCLSADREGRPANAGEVAQAIKAFREASEERANQAQIDRLRAETTAKEQTKLRRVQLVLAGTIGILVPGAMGAGWLQQQQAARIANAELQPKLDEELQKAQEREAEIQRSLAIGTFLDRSSVLLREDRAGAAANAVLALDSADKQVAEVGHMVVDRSAINGFPTKPATQIRYEQLLRLPHKTNYKFEK
jgi:hypothetical protein